jgi:hypothetical protein
VTAARILGYLSVWSAVGCGAFSAFVVVAFRTGLAYTARRQDGTLKERIPARGYLAMLVIPLGILGLQLLANYAGLARTGAQLTLGALYLLNFAHYLILFLYDTLVIDGLVIGMWRPAFLRLPEEMASESMRRHILVSVPVGTLLGALIVAISTTASSLILFGR